MESHVTLIRALVASVPAGMLFAGALALFLRGRALSSLLQLLGAGGLVVVVLAHVCEALHLFPSMEWDSNGAPVITSIWGVLFSGSHRSPWAICFMHST